MPKTSHEYRLNYQYGITVKEYKKLEALQGNLCAICGCPPKSSRLHIDHKHLLKERQLRKKKQQHLIRQNVRGLLCWRHNSAIAKFRDNPEHLRKAAEYLENPPAYKIIKRKNP